MDSIAHMRVGGHGMRIETIFEDTRFLTGRNLQVNFEN